MEEAIPEGAAYTNRILNSAIRSEPDWHSEPDGHSEPDWQSSAIEKWLRSFPIALPKRKRSAVRLPGQSGRARSWRCKVSSAPGRRFSQKVWSLHWVVK